MKPHRDHLLIHSHYTFHSDSGIWYAIAICRLTMASGILLEVAEIEKIPGFDCDLLI